MSDSVNGIPGSYADAALMARVAAGETREPVALLYQRYGQRVYALGMRWLDDRGLAEDLVQDTFVRLWRSAHRYDPDRGTVATFVFTIARRAAIDLGRRRASRPPTARQDAGDEADEDAEGIDELILGLDVRAALQALGDKHRQVLELHFDHGLQQQQIAERLRVPLGTVKTRTYYGLKALRLQLEERGLLA